MDEVRRLRKLKGLTQVELAERSGVSAYTITEIETGQRDPRPSTLRKLANALEVEVADLFPKARAPQESGQAEAASDVEEQAWAWGTQLTRRANEGERILKKVIADPESTGRGDALDWWEDAVALLALVDMHAGEARERDRVRAAENRLREVLARGDRFFGQEIHEHDDERWEQRARFMRQHAKARPREAADEAGIDVSSAS